MTELLEKAVEAVRRQAPDVQDRVAEAILMLIEEEGPADLEIAELRVLWRAGLESGPGRYASLDEIKREARRRLRVSSAPGS